MMSMTMAILGNTYYIHPIEKIINEQTIEADKALKKFETSRIAKVQKVERLSALSEQEKEIKGISQFQTEVTLNQQGLPTEVLTTNTHGYRQIQLDGTRTKQKEGLSNPAKIKAAYFNDEI